MSRTPRARSHTSTPVQGEGACTWRAWRVGVQVVCERPLIGSTSACACVQTGRGGGAVARTSLPAPLHHRSERLERLVSATILPPSTLCSTIRYTVCVHYKPITENSNCTLLLRYCTVCTRYSYPWVRGALSTESRISVKRRSIQDFPGLGPLCELPLEFTNLSYILKSHTIVHHLRAKNPAERPNRTGACMSGCHS